MTDDEYQKRLKAELDREHKSREKMEELAREDFGKFIEGIVEHQKMELAEALRKGDPKTSVMAIVEHLEDGGELPAAQETGYETLEMQIIALWRKRGLVVKEIRVDPPDEDGGMKWTVTAEELDGS